MALETKPALEVGKAFVPAGSSRYPYRDGESFVTIAAKHHIEDPWDLIYFNFRTKNPREVNWYLKHYCGCTRQTADGHNYMFSSGDRRDGQPGYIYIPTTTLEMEPLVITPRSGIWFGFGVKVDAGVGAGLTPVYGGLVSYDRLSDWFGIALEGATVNVGGNFSVGGVVLLASGLHNPMELDGSIYEGSWDLQLQLGENWGKIFKYLKGTRKMGPFVKAFSQVAGHKLGWLIAALRKEGKVGKSLGQLVRSAVRLNGKEWERLRDAVKLSLGVLGLEKYKDVPKLTVLDVPGLSKGIGLGVSKTLAEVHILGMSLQDN
jgi:hypothetical protein